MKPWPGGMGAAASDGTRREYTVLDVAIDRGFTEIAGILASVGAVSSSDAADSKSGCVQQQRGWGSRSTVDIMNAIEYN